MKMLKTKTKRNFFTKSEWLMTFVFHLEWSLKVFTLVGARCLLMQQGVGRRSWSTRPSQDRYLPMTSRQSIGGEPQNRQALRVCVVIALTYPLQQTAFNLLPLYFTYIYNTLSTADLLLYIKTKVTTIIIGKILIFLI